VQFLAGPGDIRKRSWVAFEGSRMDHSRLVDCQRATSGHLARRCAASGRGFSTLAGTNMSNAVVWHTGHEGELAAVFGDGLREEAFSREDFASLKADIKTQIPGQRRREFALNRIEKLNPGIFGPFGPEVSVGQAPEKGRVDKGAYQKALAVELKSLACSGNESTADIVRGLIKYKRIADTGLWHRH
jgi:hypothetical protein